MISWAIGPGLGFQVARLGRWRSRLRLRRLSAKMLSGRAGGGDVRSGGPRGPPVALGTLYLWALGSRHKSATELWRRWPRQRRRQRRRQLWGLRLGVCRPPLLLGPGMYKWLIRILGTIFRFCDRPVPSARALLKRRRSNRWEKGPSHGLALPLPHPGFGWRSGDPSRQAPLVRNR